MMNLKYYTRSMIMAKLFVNNKIDYIVDKLQDFGKKTQSLI